MEEITLASLLPTEIPATDAERLEIFARARAGDPAALPMLRAILDARPALADQLVESLGIATSAAEAIVHLEPANELAKEAYRREIATITRDLAGDPTAAVRLLARRAAFCWVALNMEEERLANGRRGLPLADLSHRLAMIDGRHRQVIESIQALALARTDNPPDRPKRWPWRWWRRAVRTATETSV